MAFEKFLEGCKAEAVDECGVWCRCTVLSKTEEGVTVSFDGWNAEFVTLAVILAQSLVANIQNKYIQMIQKMVDCKPGGLPLGQPASLLINLQG